MNWLRKYIWEIMLNGVALLLFVMLFVQMVTLRTGFPAPVGWDFIAGYRSTNLIGSPLFSNAGHWAVRFLLFSLAMSPLYIYTGWRPALRLRKPAGLWAVAFAGLHVWLFTSDLTWGKTWYETYARIGFVAFIILLVLALTSHQLAMRLLKKNWKRLHRIVYIAGILVVLHGLLAASDWQKSIAAEAHIWEMRFYCVLLPLLLILRLPFVRTVLKRAPRKVKRQREYVPVLD